MRIAVKNTVVSLFTLCALIGPGLSEQAASLSDQFAFRRGGGGDLYINLAVESVEVNTGKEKRGDTIDFIVTLHNKGEEIARPVTVRALSGKRVLGEVVVSRYDWNVKNRMVVKVDWDTSGFEPGEYPVKVEAPLFGDADDFDNVYKLPSNIVLK